MKKGTLLMLVQSVLCVLYVMFLSVSVVRLFQEGCAYRLDGHPSEWIYTREKAGKLLLTSLPLFLLSAGTTVASVMLGVQSQNKPAKDAELIRDLTVSRVKTPSSEMQAERAKRKKLHFGGWCGFAVCLMLRDRSLERETALAKSCEKGNPATNAAASSKSVLIARAVVLAAAIVFILLGIFNGSMKDVLYKAINICTECIGLG